MALSGWMSIAAYSKVGMLIINQQLNVRLGLEDCAICILHSAHARALHPLASKRRSEMACWPVVILASLS